MIGDLEAEVSRLATALAEAEARGRRQGLEEAARYHDNAAICEERIKARSHRLYAADIRSLATAPAETQKPETGESDHA
jgi:hypothetical protein